MVGNKKITTKHLNLYIIFWFCQNKKGLKRPQKGLKRASLRFSFKGLTITEYGKPLVWKVVFCELWLWNLGLLNMSSEECLYFLICFECVGTRSYIVWIWSLSVWISLSPQTGVDAKGNTKRVIKRVLVKKFSVYPKSLTWKVV